MHSGHINIHQADDANIFFWLVQHHHKLQSNNLIIWLNGGPGCSSMDGVFMENGPFRVNNDLTLKLNEYSWFYDADLLFVDQPVNTGFSLSSNKNRPASLIEVQEDFLIFLENFFTVFPHLSKYSLKIAGESFAGTYIPYIAKGILDQNENSVLLDSHINLSGIIIGNGWMDPIRQYKAYIDFAVYSSLIDINDETNALAVYDRCRQQMEKTEAIHNTLCESILSMILRATEKGGKFCINMYDVRLRDEDSLGGCGLLKWPPSLPLVTRYLQQKDVVTAIHAQKKNPTLWVECSGVVSSALSHDKSPPSYKLLPFILERISVVLFSGDKDLICNYMGTEAMIEGLEWNGELGFGKSKLVQNWFIGDDPFGSYISARNLTYIRIFNASHMVPVDNGIAGLDIINRILGISDIITNSYLVEAGGKGIPAKPDNTTSPPPPPAEIPIATADDTTDLGDSESFLWFVFVLLVIFALIAAFFYRNRLVRIYRSLMGVRGGRNAYVGTEWHELATNDEGLFQGEDGWANSGLEGSSRVVTHAIE